MLFLVPAVWIVATAIAFINGRRGLALVSLVLGGALTYGLFAGWARTPGLVALIILDIILLITNKYDMR
jgi:hypothetical protein